MTAVLASVSKRRSRGRSSREPSATASATACMPTPNSVFTTFHGHAGAARPHIKPLLGNSGQNWLGRFKDAAVATTE